MIKCTSFNKYMGRNFNRWEKWSLLNLQANSFPIPGTNIANVYKHPVTNSLAFEKPTYQIVPSGFGLGLELMAST